jgi:hypothetical protein
MQILTLCLLHSWNYRHDHQALGSKDYFFLKRKGPTARGEQDWKPWLSL